MSFINTVEPTQASDRVAALYQRLQGSKHYLPNYARVFSHRPDIMPHISSLQESIATAMPPRLWALISLAVAVEIKVSYCALAYARRLLGRYFDEGELLAILLQRADAPITEAESAAMKLAAKMARDSSAVTQADIDALRHCGYTDSEIFDTVAAAAYRCFFAKLADALGVEPDACYSDMHQALLQRLVVGRRIEGETRVAAQAPLSGNQN